MHSYQFSVFNYNPDTRELTWQQVPDSDHKPEKAAGSQYLRKKVADVLHYLLENRERVVSKDELLQNIWLQGEFRENSLLQSIRELRKLLGESAQSPKFIRTVHLKGYQWIYGEVRLISPLIEKTESVEKTAITETKAEQSENKPQATTKQISTGPVSGEHQTTGQSSEPQRQSSPGRNTKAAPLLALTTLLALTLVLVIAVFFWPSKDTVQTQLTANHAEVAVLPFINDTGDSELQWLELGYSDMFAQGLRKFIPLQVIPSYHLQGAMAIRQLDKRLSDSEQISGLLAGIKAKYAIAATINKDGKALRFNYRIHDLNGVFASGSIRFPNLPSSLPTLIGRVSQHLTATSTDNEDTGGVLFNSKEAQQDYAKGMQALQTKGAKLAKRYFEAALLNEPGNLAATAKLADTLSLLAESEQAQSYYRQLLASPALSQDAFLASSVYLGLAKLLIQQHRLKEVEQLIEQGLALTQDKALRYQRAELLRSRANYFHALGDNKQRHQLLSRADELSRPFASLQNEADALYYLGSPTNIGLETDPDINLRQNQPKLEQALKYYQKLGNKRGEALTLLAIGQNYYFDVKKRLEALEQAKALFIQTGNRLDLIDTLNYIGYFFIQYHKGELARQSLEQAITLLAPLNDPHRAQRSYFFYAFSSLDQGINNEGSRAKAFLASAIDGFETNIEKYAQITSSSITADSHLLLAWAYSESGLPLQAIPHIELALKTYQQQGYPVSIQYAQVSLLDEYIKLGQWQKVVSLAANVTDSYLANIYLARAYYELDNLEKARQTMAFTKTRFSERWSQADEKRLSLYDQRLKNAGPLKLEKAALGEEISSHQNYCDDLWNTDNIDTVIQLTTSASN
ncbi:winged helix-turn-helix domain-containing protein [Thalassomonas haliotis]|uniref:Winged helix-turn-helix domain-containing protein n=1 Tax=Thalassomonas haliotis TaxID=485448 RepID=A0ABY7VB00_9GAMM|nr:winged helix-turn-helix domain-containing protein [Thalassomonas haliotis]WDE10805.1 winged helix-turn-helix domain-containing protein [Thalassomonas haliotis]